jgi:outer membrane protein OmpA-like peptidoglycan-associated protein
MFIKTQIKKYSLKSCLIVLGLFLLASGSRASASDRDEKRESEIKTQQEQFTWWPTDAKPEPVKDDRGGYWWWPTQPGQQGPLWGNRGYVYVYKIIYDYKADELPAPQPQELRPSLVIKKILKNVKIYFDYNKSTIREDASVILKEAAQTLRRNPDSDILVTGNCDTRGSENYNEKLGRQRAETVKTFLIGQGVDEDRVRIVSRGKLDAVAPVTDLVGMQKDRNAQFMIAEVEEVMIPYAGSADAEAPETLAMDNDETAAAPDVEKETIESAVQVETKEYTIRKNDSLWSIAQKELGSGHRWKYLYELNRDRIKNPNKLRVGTTIVIPVE